MNLFRHRSIRERDNAEIEAYFHRHPGQAKAAQTTF